MNSLAILITNVMLIGNITSANNNTLLKYIRYCSFVLNNILKILEEKSDAIDQSDFGNRSCFVDYQDSEKNEQE